MSQKIVVNDCYGGFGLSTAAVTRLRELGVTGASEYEVQSMLQRDDHRLVQMLEELGSEAASGEFAELAIVEIPDDVDWVIDEEDGAEWVAETHNTWFPHK